MHARKDLLDKLAARSAGSLPDHDVTAFRGEMAVETKNTTYRFRDGVCIDVTRRRALEGARSTLLGMRIVGWMKPGPGARLEAAWSEGASAVLWRRSEASESGAMALTSPTVKFTRVPLLRVVR